MIDIVHPQLYNMRVRGSQEMMSNWENIIRFISMEGTFSVKRNQDGQLNIEKQK